MTSLSLSPEFYQGPIEKLFSDEVTLIDVRAPIEFLAGAFPNSINLPVLSDEQRHQIGICYKQSGQEAAIALGHQSVSGPDREKKIAAWLNQLQTKEQKEIYLYCFRGGLRSQISQQWIRDQGKNVLIIKDGYKRLRTFLIENIHQQVEKNSFLVISGNTGSGKTNLLNALSEDGYKSLDLEKLANHRGSVFGCFPTPQPTQINFENALSIQFLKEMRKKGKSILLEDEGKKVGHCIVPIELHAKQNRSRIFVYEKSLDERIALILKEYCVDSWKDFEHRENSYEQFFAFFKASFDQIQKRLGGALYQECLLLLRGAIEEQQKHGSFFGHQDWISKILVQYYDPFYEAGLNRKKELIIDRGDELVLRDILKD